MMSTIKSIRGGFGLAAVATALLLATGPATANLIDNGDFEGGTVSDGGHPDPVGWTVNDHGFYPLEVINENSAFNADANNSHTARASDIDETANSTSDNQGIRPTMKQTFSSSGVTGRYVFRFDFRHRAGETADPQLNDFNGNRWSIQVFSSLGVENRHPMAAEYRIDAPDGDDADSDPDHFSVFTEEGTDVGVNGLSASTWYRVRAVLDTSTQTQSGWIKEAGSTSPLATWSDVPFTEDESEHGFGFAEDLATVRLRDHDGASGVTDVDNITMIPEPASLALLAPAGLALLRRRRS